MPPKLKTPHSRMPAKEPVPKEPLHTTSKPKMPPSPEVADTTSVPKDERLSLKPDPEVTHSETAPLETRGIPLIPVISPRPSQEELQTAMAPHRLHTAPVRPRIPGRPHGRPALNKTTTRPDKTKPRGTSP
ncbi:ABI gene family, member 3 (NESH) binding protein, isoform CRA_c [Mus musculus]|nr:ABI gene family, member 3 (NESH) binding protein, isoform CRA_c [Mus musculus]